jgi:hypothetical protein
VIRAAIACLALVGGAAAAACPDPAAMSGAGVTLRMKDRAITFRALGGSLIEGVLTMADGGVRTRARLAQGLIPVVTEADFADPAIPDQTTALDLTPADLSPYLPFGPDTEFVVETVLTDRATGDAEGIAISVRAGPSGQIRIGDCLIQGQRLILTYTRPGNTWLAEAVWLPDFGFAYVDRTQLDQLPMETLEPLSLEAA